MAAAIGRAGFGLRGRLFDSGFGFDFHQAARLLGMICREQGLDPEKALRYHALVSTSFPPSQIQEIRAEDAGDGELRRLHATVAFLGLTGPQGALPVHYTERLIERRRLGDVALEEFLDLFNNRLIALFQTAWERPRFYISYERTRGGASGEDAFRHYLLDLIGLGTKGLANRLAVADDALLFYAGLIAQRPRSASALRGLLRDYFGVPAVVEQFAGRWFHIPAEDLTYSGRENDHARLGAGAVAGDAVWNRQAGFRIRLGPLSLRRYLEFLPGARAWRELIELTRFFAGIPLQFEVQLVLAADETPFPRLHEEGDEAPRLGWLGWLKTEALPADPDDAVFSLAGESVLS